jgi:hypothetical protein
LTTCSKAYSDREIKRPTAHYAKSPNSDDKDGAFEYCNVGVHQEM